jgi:hypothetical protein
MTLVPLKFPPGIFRNGTKYEAKGRWYDSNLVRWYDATGPQPIGGWEKVQEGSPASDIDLGEPIRGLYGWKNNAGSSFFAAGTPTKAYGYIEGTLADITIAGLTTGQSDASYASGGFGQTAYSAGPYGTANPLASQLTEANTWQWDNFGEVLVGMAHSDGRILQWDLITTNNLTVVTNAPTSCLGVVVTPERFLVALGADGDPRSVAWADQESLTDWTATATNQAGDFPLSTPGRLMTGRRAKNETLIWTDIDLWSMRYIGGKFIYQFLPVGTNCGAISRMGVAVVDTQAYWMGKRGFFLYDGYTKGIPCEVSDYVFNDINLTQASKICAYSLAEFRSVRWHYPSAGSEENDRYVEYNYGENHWVIGELERTSGFDYGAYDTPIVADAQGGIYKHEIGISYTDVDDSTELVPTAESGPVEIAQGDQVVQAVYLIPDEKTLGDVQATFLASLFPNESETTHGPYTLAKQTDVRFTGRQVRLKLTQVSANWRFGVPRLDVRAGGRR